MSWKALKRLWPQSVDINAQLDNVYGNTNVVVSTRYGRPSPTEATAIGYAIIDSAKTRGDGALHLVIGPYSLWNVYYVYSILKEFGFNHKVTAVVPEFLCSEMYEDLHDNGIEDITLLRHGRESDIERMRGQDLASVYVCSYEHMFNWEYYDLDLSPGGYVIFSDVDLPVVRTYSLTGWKLKGKYGNLYFVSRGKSIAMDIILTEEEEDRLASSSDDPDKSRESESTEEDIQELR